MGICTRCNGSGILLKDKVMAVTSPKTGVTYSETVIVQEQCPNCTNGQIPDANTTK